MGVAGNWGRQKSAAPSYTHEIAAMSYYAQYIGWTVQHMYLNEDDLINDEKIAILKLAPVGEVIKDVGIRLSPVEFYIMREPK